MYCTKKITDDITWVGANDRRIALFENVYPVPRGVSYNSYIINDEKTVLLDTVDKNCSGRFFENIAHTLGSKPLDYVVINHMEPDHCALLEETVLRYPALKVICNAKAAAMIKQFFDFDIDSRCIIVKEGDSFSCGKHTLNFVMAPMVHWPEAMMTYDSYSKILFSADAFGTFGAINGNLFADELDFEKDILDEARRYYTNIVGKYGPSVQTVLSKAAGLDIQMICPLHGPIWRENLGIFIEKYQKWSSYEPEDNSVVIAYASVYGDTENAAELLASNLADYGIKNIQLYDVSVTHPSYIVAEAFRASHLVFASTTYNSGIFVTMENLLSDLKAHNLQNRTVAIIENGSWAPTAGKLMKEFFNQMKNITLIENMPSIRSAVKDENRLRLESLAAEIAASVNGSTPDAPFHCPHCGHVLGSADEKCTACAK